MTLNSRLAEAYGEPLDIPRYNLWDLFKTGADENPDHVAVIALHQPYDHLSHLTSEPDTDFTPKLYSKSTTPHLSWTYRQLIRAAERLASAFKSQGVGNGDIILVLTYSCVEWALIQWAAARIGAVFSSLDPLDLGREDTFRHYLSSLQPKVVVVGDFEHTILSREFNPNPLDNVATKLFLRGQTDGSCLGESFESLDLFIKRSDSSFLTEGLPLTSPASPEDTAVIQYTSGTTAMPKSCPCTAKYWTAMTLGAQKQGYFDQSTRFLQFAVCFRVTCQCWSVCTWGSGGTVIFSDWNFSPENSLAAVESSQPNTINLPPSRLKLCAEIQLQLRKRYKTDSLKLLIISGDVVHGTLVGKAKAAFDADHVLPVFGMNEGLFHLYWKLSDIQTTSSSGIVSLGGVSPGARIRICKPLGRELVQRGEIGILHVGGPMTITHYLQNRDSKSFYEDVMGNWMITGDVAIMDEAGVVQILGRGSDEIKIDTVKHSPARIEFAIQKVDGIEAHVIGIPSEIHGQIPVAVLNIQKTTEETKQRIREMVLKEVGEQCHFDRVYTLEDLRLEVLPVNQTGKVVKRDLTVAVVNYGFTTCS